MTCDCRSFIFPHQIEDHGVYGVCWLPASIHYMEVIVGADF